MSDSTSRQQLMLGLDTAIKGSVATIAAAAIPAARSRGKGVVVLFNVDPAALRVGTHHDLHFFTREEYTKQLEGDPEVPEETFDDAYWNFDPERQIRLVVFCGPDQSLESRFDCLITLDPDDPPNVSTSYLLQ